MMGITEVYGVAAAGSVVLLLLIHSIVRVRPYLPSGALLQKYSLYPILLRRHRLLGPWTYAQVAIQLIYLAANIFCVVFRVSDASEAATRAGHLSLINMIPGYFGFHLSFVSDLLGISLSKYRVFHASTGAISIFLGLLHVIIHVSSKGRLRLNETSQLFGLIAIVSMLSLLLLSPILRSFSYELFLRTHQALAITITYSLWRHVVSRSLPRLYLMVSGGTFVTIFALQLLSLLYRNVSFHRGSPRVLIARHNGAVRMTVFVPRPWRGRAGQHVNVWIPSISLWSSFQSHPFTIASWSGGKKPSIDLLIEPGDGFTRKLFERANDYEEPQDSAVESDKAFGHAGAQDNPRPSEFRMVFFSGPHGCLPTSVGDYGKILMIATGFGITAQLPLLKELIQGFNSSVVRTRDITLMWQLQHHGDEKPASDLLDRVLEEDVLDKGYMLHICMFYKRGLLDPSPQYGGRHGRLAYHNGTIDLPSLLEDQKGSKETDGERKTLITVSANTQVRDKLRDLVRPRIDENLRFLELDYQPAEKKRHLWPFVKMHKMNP